MKNETDASMSRREVMRRLALLPIEMWGLSAFGPIITDPTEEILKPVAI